MAYLLSRNGRIEEDLIDQLFSSSKKRLARLLLLANFEKEGAPQPMAAQVSQETLAEVVGTTRSRVSFFMNKFRKLGFISYNGKIEVHNSLLNAVLYDKLEIKRDDKLLTVGFVGWCRVRDSTVLVCDFRCGSAQVADASRSEKICGSSNCGLGFA